MIDRRDWAFLTVTELPMVSAALTMQADLRVDIPDKVRGDNFTIIRKRRTLTDLTRAKMKLSEDQWKLGATLQMLQEMIKDVEAMERS